MTATWLVSQRITGAICCNVIAGAAPNGSVTYLQSFQDLLYRIGDGLYSIFGFDPPSKCYRIIFFGLGRVMIRHPKGAVSNLHSKLIPIRLI